MVLWWYFQERKKLRAITTQLTSLRLTHSVTSDIETRKNIIVESHSEEFLVVVSYDL